MEDWSFTPNNPIPNNHTILKVSQLVRFSKSLYKHYENMQFTDILLTRGYIYYKLRQMFDVFYIRRHNKIS